MDQIYKTDLNELFSYQRKGEKLEEKEKVIEIEIERLRDFKEHPFHVKDDKEMSLLKESIKNYGILSPLIVRPVLDGVYEIVSGHRRKYAAQQLGYYKLPVIIRVMNDDEAIISMVDSNLQRERIRYSEKAFAYKMKLEAMKHQGKVTSCKDCTKTRSDEMIAQEAHVSARTIQNYIRLTYLVKPILDQVDEGRIAFSPAVELSFMSRQEQAELWDIMNSEDSTPSLSQAVRLKKLSQKGELTPERIYEIMREEKANQRERVRIDVNQLRKYFPKGYTALQMEKKILQLLEENYQNNLVIK